MNIEKQDKTCTFTCSVIGSSQGEWNEFLHIINANGEKISKTAIKERYQQEKEIIAATVVPPPLLHYQTVIAEMEKQPESIGNIIEKLNKENQKTISNDSFNRSIAIIYRFVDKVIDYQQKNQKQIFVIFSVMLAIIGLISLLSLI